MRPSNSGLLGLSAEFIYEIQKTALQISGREGNISVEID